MLFLERVTNPQNPQKPDIAAIEAFCVTILKETEGVHIASKLLATHIVESTSEWEALQALSVYKLFFYNIVQKRIYFLSRISNSNAQIRNH